ncbi:uncharacterized protein LOC116186455 isoform X2 [Apis dorsata]|uniref:uncharacterized protein LOC116186455 isoform X2 n=1 Tax=Apis dorsata TaxID=7462 RepID=UPI001293094C|nr:uncharacterized protein LOC116186455 isoform X2 [Apis dorsata]
MHSVHKEKQFSVAGDIKECASLPSSRYRNKGGFIKTGNEASQNNLSLSIDSLLPTWQQQTPGITNEMFYIVKQLANQVCFSYLYEE